MKKILLIFSILISAVAWSQPQTIHSVVSIAAMKAYYGNATRIYVTSTNEDYVNCPSCTADELLVFDGVGSRNWKKVVYNSENPTTNPGPNWQHSDSSYSPYQMNSRDTILTTGVPTSPTADVPLSGIYADRTLYFSSGAYHLQKLYGHYLRQTFIWPDSISFDTQGGDYNVGTTIEQRLKPEGSGKKIARAAHGTNADLSPFNGVPTLMANTVLENSGSNYIYTRGWIVGISSYLVAGFNNADTLERFSFFQTNAFLSANSHVKKAYQFDMQNYTAGARVDSSFGLWDQNGFRHYLRGSLKLGILDSTVTGYQFKVGGASYFRGLVQMNQGTDVASTAGVMTLNNDGNVFEITGTNTITAINNTNLKNGFTVVLLFTSTATLTDGTANSGAAIGMELSGNTNFTGSADDAVILQLCEIGGTQRWRQIGGSVN